MDVSGHYAVLSHPEATAPVLIYTLMRLLNRFVTHRSVTGIRYSIQLSTGRPRRSVAENESPPTVFVTFSERLLLNVFRVLLGYPFNQCGALFPYAFQDSLQVCAICYNIV